MSKPDITPKEALARLRATCSRGEYSTGEVRRKLAAWKQPQQVADRIVELLVRDRYVDDTRFAREFARNRLIYRGWGPRKIRAQLYTKGIDNATADDAIAELCDDDITRSLIATIRSKARVAPETPAERMKLMRFVMQRGFDPSLASALIKEQTPWVDDDSY